MSTRIPGCCIVHCAIIIKPSWTDLLQHKEVLKVVIFLVRSYCLAQSKPSGPWLRCGEKAQPLFLISDWFVLSSHLSCWHSLHRGPLHSGTFLEIALVKERIIVVGFDTHSNRTRYHHTGNFALLASFSHNIRIQFHVFKFMFCHA